jgi:ferredoxin
MKIVIDWDLCQGHGVCEGEAESVFSVDEEGKLTVLMEEPGEALRAAVDQAVLYCPQRAISIVE